MTQQNSLSANVSIADSLISLRIAISHPPNKGRFAFELVLLVLHGCLAIPILGFTLLAVSWHFLPLMLAVAVSVLGVGLTCSLFYRAFRDSLEYLYDQEVIDIDNQAIKIARSGAGFKDFVEYSADHIKAINLLFPNNPKLNWLRFLPGASSANIDRFLIYDVRGLKRMHTFGKGIQLEEARQILDSIWRRYPQYKG